MPSNASTPQQMVGWYDHLNECRDQLCGTWPHRWKATAEYRDYVTRREQRAGVKSDA